MIFNYSIFSEINEKKLVSKLKNNLGKTSSSVFFDFGCGLSKLYEKIDNKLFILSDLNCDILTLQKKHNPRNRVIYNLDELINQKVSIDYVLMNSVVQYINPSDLKKTILFLLRKLKVKKILISDIPRMNRILELISLLFLNTKNIITIYKDIFQNISKNDYQKLDFYIHKKQFFLNLAKEAKCQINFHSNFHVFKTRQALVIKNNS